jgi:indolepyruvate ferredoxin oxidoreductase beta subunit
MTRGLSFLLAGVGGQGTILASTVLADVGLATGHDVKKSEVHGMAQRGGSVNTHVRWHTDRVHSPLISLGEADYLLSFEQAEALRYAEYLRSGAVAVVNDHVIRPITVTSGGAHYPSRSDLETVFKGITGRFCIVPGAGIAQVLGSPRVANVVLLGALSAYLDITEQAWLTAVEARVPARYVELNRQAFLRGRATICS